MAFSRWQAFLRRLIRPSGSPSSPRLGLHKHGAFTANSLLPPPPFSRSSPDHHFIFPCHQRVLASPCKYINIAYALPLSLPSALAIDTLTARVNITDQGFAQGNEHSDKSPTFPPSFTNALPLFITTPPPCPSIAIRADNTPLLRSWCCSSGRGSSTSRDPP